MGKKRRLIWKLYPYFLLTIIISITAVTWYASRTLRSFSLEQIQSDLEARVLIFEKQIVSHLYPLDSAALDALCKRIGRSAESRFTIILPTGVVVGDTHEDPAKMDNHSDRPEIVEALRGRIGSSVRYSRTLRKKMMYLALSLKDKNQNLAVVRASVPVDPIDRAIRGVRIKMVFSALIIALFGAVVSLLVSRRITQPIKEIQVGAECFARGDFECRLSDSDLVEIGSLSESMNRMARDLQQRIGTITRQKNEFEAVLSSMVEGVIAVDPEERIINMNQAAGEILRCSPEQVQGRSIQEAARNVDLQNFVKETMEGESFLEREIVLYSDDDRILNAHGTMLRDEQGRRMGGLIVLNDVTRLKKLENMRRDFVANVSHEIKTPITAIKGFTETLRDGAIKNAADAERFLDIIHRHVNRLEVIIEDLLSLSRIERAGEGEGGRIPIEPGSVLRVLETACQVLDMKLKEKNVHIFLDCDGEISVPMNPPLLERAVVNLLDNAVKYSRDGGEGQIMARRLNGEIEISVRDEGCGIEKRHLSRLFERFYRVDKARSRALGGTGLGLAIVKHIIQAHGGSIHVESTPGRGSTFRMSLPAEAAMQSGGGEVSAGGPVKNR